LEMGVLRTICSGWSGTSFLLISSSQVVSITGVSYWYTDPSDLFYPGLYLAFAEPLL
jgi:hypothetical protein